MTVSEGPGSVEEEAPAVVVAGRTIGGILLVLVGGALILAGVLWYFVVPWFGWATEGFWYQMAEWADLGGVAIGVIGFVLLVLGGGLIQRARKNRLAMFIDASQLTDASDALLDDGKSEKRTGEHPPTIW